MTPQPREIWKIIRTQGNHFTVAEIARLRIAFKAGRHPKDIAEELNCSRRSANRYYAIFRGGPLKPRPTAPKITKPKAEPRSVLKPRFYTSNFELEG